MRKRKNANLIALAQFSSNDRSEYIHAGNSVLRLNASAVLSVVLIIKRLKVVDLCK